MNNASSHNAYYIERDITAWYENGSLWDRISGINGYDEFEGIFPGCWFSISRRINNPSPNAGLGNDKILILGCNSLYYIGSTQQMPIPIDIEKGVVGKITFNHIVCCPKGYFGNAHFTDPNATPPVKITGGYLGSYINQSIIGPPTTTGNIAGTVNEQLYAEFGGHLKSFMKILSSSIDETVQNSLKGIGGRLGAVDKKTITLVQSLIMSGCEVLGFDPGSSSFYDESCNHTQFPAFKFSKEAILSDVKENSYWLRSFVSYNKDNPPKPMCGSINFNGRYNEDISEKNHGIRPCFILA